MRPARGFHGTPISSPLGAIPNIRWSSLSCDYLTSVQIGGVLVAIAPLLDCQYTGQTTKIPSLHSPPAHCYGYTRGETAMDFIYLGLGNRATIWYTSRDESKRVRLGDTEGEEFREMSRRETRAPDVPTSLHPPRRLPSVPLYKSSGILCNQRYLLEVARGEENREVLHICLYILYKYIYTYICGRAW